MQRLKALRPPEWLGPRAAIAVASQCGIWVFLAAFSVLRGDWWSALAQFLTGVIMGLVVLGNTRATYWADRAREAYVENMRHIEELERRRAFARHQLN